LIDRGARDVTGEGASFSTFEPPRQPFHRAFITLKARKRKIFSARHRRRGHRSVAFRSCANCRKRRLPSVRDAMTSMTRKFRFLRIIARIQRDNAMFVHFGEKSYGRIDVHKPMVDMAWRSLLQRVFGARRCLSTGRIPCLKSIDR
jgi:hypothetical protein